MDFDKHKEIFSGFRMLRFLNAASNDKAKAVRMYKSNLQMSQALYPLISILEVSLRNVLDAHMRKEFGSHDWIMEQRNSFFNHHELTYLDRHGNICSDTLFTDKIHGAVKKLSAASAPTNHNNIVAELGLHFWIKFFDEKPIKVLKGSQMMVFKNNPHRKNKEIFTILNGIRHLRNRISHHEPICFDDNGNFCAIYAIQKYYQIIEVLRWIDDDLRDWALSYENTLGTFKTALGIYKAAPVVLSPSFEVG